MAQTPQLEIPPHVRESIDLTLEALRIRDFAAVRYYLLFVLVTPTGMPLLPLDPEAGVFPHLQRIKPLVPEIDTVRAEFTEFLKWFSDRMEKDKAEAERAVHRGESE